MNCGHLQSQAARTARRNPKLRTNHSIRVLIPGASFINFIDHFETSCRCRDYIPVTATSAAARITSRTDLCMYLWTRGSGYVLTNMSAAKPVRYSNKSGSNTSDYRRIVWQLARSVTKEMADLWGIVLSGVAPRRQPRTCLLI